MKFLVLALCITAALASPHYNALTAEQAELVRSTWKQVSHNEIDILYAIFKAHPDIQARFPAFVGKDLDELKQHAPFAVHATRIVSTFSEVIALAGDSGNQAAIKTILNELGHSHRNRGIPENLFNEFRDAFVGYLKAHVSWGDNVDAAWNQALDNTYFIIFAALGGNPVH